MCKNTEYIRDIIPENAVRIEEMINYFDYNYPAPKELDAQTIAKYAEIVPLVPEYVKVKGTLAISGNYYNLKIGGATLIGSITYPTDDLTAFDGKEIEVEGFTKVSANLKLERDSCPLQLSVSFKSADGGRLGEERLTVRRSSARRFPVPEGAKLAVFSLRKNSVDELSATIILQDYLDRKKK